MRYSKNLLSSAITSGFLILLSAHSHAEEDTKPAVKVSVEQAVKQDVAEHIWVPGTVVSRNDARLATEVAGRIHHIAEIGDTFKKGDVLVELDDQLIQLALLDEQANVKRLVARVQLLSKQLQRLTKIADNAAVDDVDEKTAALAMARQELARAKIAERRGQYLLSQTRLKAPFDGTVVQRLQQPGEFSTQGGNVLRIVDMNNLEVKVAAPLTSAAHIQSGISVEVKDTIRSVINQVRTLVPVGDDRSRMMELRVSLEPGQWPVGSPVRVGLPNSAFHTAMTVPRDALVLRKNNTYLFVVDEEQLAQRIDVTLGIGVQDYIEVQGDVQEGDRVITRGAERLEAGQKVAVKERAAALPSLANAD